MKANKGAQVVFVVLFSAILYGGLFVFLWKPKETVSYYENRMLAERPRFSLSTLWDGSYFSGWSDYVSDHTPGRTTLLRLDAWLDWKVLRRPVVNGVVAAGETLLDFYPAETVDAASVTEASGRMADQFARLNEQVTGYGGVFLYVAVPGQTSYLAGEYPWYLYDRQDRDLLERDAFAADLKRRGVPFLDVGAVYGELGHPAEFYSNTDYHYTYWGAFAAYQALMEQVRTLSGLDLKAYQADEIDFQQLKNPYLGSRLRKLTGQADGREHPVIGLFKEPVAFTRYEGEVQSAASCYALPGNEWEDVSYSVYMGGDCAETTLRTDRPELPDLLVFGDSFTNPLETLLYASFDETRSLDLRHFGAQSLFDYVDANRPDVVVCVRDYEALLDFNGNGTLG